MKLVDIKCQAFINKAIEAGSPVELMEMVAKYKGMELSDEDKHTIWLVKNRPGGVLQARVELGDIDYKLNPCVYEIKGRGDRANFLSGVSQVLMYAFCTGLKPVLVIGASSYVYKRKEFLDSLGIELLCPPLSELFTLNKKE